MRYLCGMAYPGTHDYPRVWGRVHTQQVTAGDVRNSTWSYMSEYKGLEILTLSGRLSSSLDSHSIAGLPGCYAHVRCSGWLYNVPLQLITP